MAIQPALSLSAHFSFSKYPHWYRLARLLYSLPSFSHHTMTTMIYHCANGQILTIDNYGSIPFRMDEIFKLQQHAANVCPDWPGLVLWNDTTRVFSGDEIARITGSSSDSFLSIWNFTPYDSDIILRRFQAWKIPLVELLMQFPRAPHGAAVETMSFFHLMGDPIDTIASLIFTLQVTQNRLRRFRSNGMRRKSLEELTLLIMAFEEMGDEETVYNLERQYVPKLFPLRSRVVTKTLITNLPFPLVKKKGSLRIRLPGLLTTKPQHAA